MSLALIIRLLSLFMGLENAAVIHDNLPSRLAGLHLPRGTQVIVSYVRRESPFSFSAGVELETTLSSDVFYAQMDWVLARSGWKPVRISLPTIEPFPFKPSDLPPPETGLVGTPFFQKDGLTLTLDYPTNRLGRSTRAYFQVESGDRPAKDLLPPEKTGVLEFFPSLSMPEGAEMGAMFASESNDGISASIGVTTNLFPTQLAEHFAVQLSAGGWHVTEKKKGKESTFVTLEYSGDGQTYDAQLSVSRLQGQAYSTVDLEAALREDK